MREIVVPRGNEGKDSQAPIPGFKNWQDDIDEFLISPQPSMSADSKRESGYSGELLHEKVPEWPTDSRQNKAR